MSEEKLQVPESICYEYNGGRVNTTDRIKVYQGWLVRTILRSKDSVSVHTVFIKDDLHQWIPGKVEA